MRVHGNKIQNYHWSQLIEESFYQTMYDKNLFTCTHLSIAIWFTVNGSISAIARWNPSNFPCLRHTVQWLGPAMNFKVCLFDIILTLVEILRDSAPHKRHTFRVS